MLDLPLIIEGNRFLDGSGSDNPPPRRHFTRATVDNLRMACQPSLTPVFSQA